MQLPSFKYKNTVINIAIIILALVIASNIYKKQVNDLDSLKQKKEEEIKKCGVLENISNLEKKINSYKNTIPAKDANLVINAISNIARDSGVKILSIKPVAEQRQPDYINIPFDLTVSAANYHIIGELINRLETYQDIYKVDSLEIRSDEKTNELTANLRVSAIGLIN